ncbi:TPA: DUF4263 domain-containing protein [Vibrio vulnificus]|nr:DUF4263 domain-containing protein [Vibrio vulnificus]HAT8516489.1 DUF4263 domain-containing protein [Vibrio vulnificus]
MHRFNLTNYQLDAFRGVINEYECGGNSALVLMPAGTGKTVLATRVLKYLTDKYKVKNIAHVSMFKALSSHVNKVFENEILPEEKTIVTYTYAELSDAIANNSISKESFELVVFDGLDEFESTKPDMQLYGSTLSYFNCFKIGFGRGIHSEVSKNFKLVYRYSYEQSIQDGSFLYIQKLLKENYIDHLDSFISNLHGGSLLTNDVKESLQNEVNTLKKENLEFQKSLKMLLDGELNKDELIEMSYRIEQLKIFEQMLKYSDVDDKVSERAWQQFFERNQWIFGLGLNYIFNASLEGEKLEKTVSGASVSGSGKRVDALLRTTGIIQSLSFGEIKTNRTQVLKSVKEPYRADSWAISDEFAGAIAQVQRTVQKSLMNISEQLTILDKDGYRKQDPIYLYKPKAFLVIGSLEEFKNDKGLINESKFSSFELFRRSISDIEIITFDELYSRACALSNKQTKWE